MATEIEGRRLTDAELAYEETRRKVAQARERQLAKAVADRTLLRECIELIQGQNWQLQEDEFGREIKRRCLAALTSTQSTET